METLVPALIYPLRNALLYKLALEKAYRDPLTGVSNRAALDFVLEQELDLAQRHNSSLALIMFDIDRFKVVNDNYGHIAGDVVLKHVADCMIESTRRSDIIYRYGGEEFVILLRSTDESGALLLAERIRISVESMTYDNDGQIIQVTISGGLAIYRDGDTSKSLLERGDQALYQAKKKGRNQVVMESRDTPV